MSARLMIGASEQVADLLYATQFMAPDPFLWFEHRGKTVGAFTPLEIDRARRTATVDLVVPWELHRPKLEKKLGRPPRPFELTGALLRERKIRSVTVPDWTRVGDVRDLESLGFRVAVASEPFFPGRQIKGAKEIKGIEAGQRAAEAGMERAFEVLQAAQVRSDKKLVWAGGVLTSERLRGEIDAAVVRAGAIPSGTIVAGGKQACDPHERGFGPLKAGESIIIDIFPRDARTGYFGDLTRTVVKGVAPDALRKMYATVQEGKRKVLGEIRSGASGRALHESLVELFKLSGFPTEQRNGRWVGFFHGTGHSLGLEIHEAPRFSATEFPPGLVMTVEPGIYDPKIGGVRLEDLVVVGKRGIRNLTRVREVLEI